MKNVLERSRIFCSAIFVTLACVSFIAPAAAAPSHSPRHFAFILCGIPGEKEQRARFEKLAGGFYDFFTDQCGYAPKNVWLCFDGNIPQRKIVHCASDLKTLKRVFLTFSDTIQAHDTVVFVLIGHGDRSEGIAKLHLRGPDLSARSFANFVGILPKNVETDFILTMPYSGDWIKPLARKGRLIIAATQPKQRRCVETIFPDVLLNVVNTPSDTFAGPDHFLSYADIFASVRKQIAQRFALDHLVPTEEPSIDDSGDGIPAREIIADGVDGQLARKRGFHLRVTMK